MTLKELQQLLDKQSGVTTEREQKLYERLRGLDFWIADKEAHRQAFKLTNSACCLNHVLGLPEKNGIAKPIFDYEQDIVRLLEEQTKYLWILKFVGAGITELCLRWIVWKCTVNDDWKHRQVPIIVGPNTELAIKLIRRIRRMFERHEVYWDTKETYLEINGAEIECFSSHHLDSFRSLESPACIYISEGDFFPESQNVRQISERYLSKSNPYIIMESTPGLPGGLFDTISKEEPCLYTKVRLDYTYGLRAGMITQQEVDNARRSPSFEREMNLKFGYALEGSVFHTKDVDAALAHKYDVNYINPFGVRSMGIDTGFGSSAFAILLTQYNNGMIEVLQSIELARVDFIEALNQVTELYQKYEPCTIYIDGSNPAFVRAIKGNVGDTVDYERIISEAKRDHIDPEQRLERVIPVNFSTRHKELLMHCKMTLESGQVAIDPRFDKLERSLRSAVEKDGALDKGATQYDDTLDAFRLSLQGFKYGD
ncbi:MAG: hypothetical protein M3044_09870 [Thermoproteota archaeon]|nr:hypothetical protein [Thermoproteota archaeon]